MVKGKWMIWEWSTGWLEEEYDSKEEALDRYYECIEDTKNFFNEEDEEIEEFERTLLVKVEDHHTYDYLK